MSWIGRGAGRGRWSMSSLVAVRVGVQIPRVVLEPQGVARSWGPDAAELSARCGLVLDVWQRAVLDVGMGERADGQWCAADVDVIASRQNGKNGTVEARELYGAAVLGESIIHTAHLFKTTKESYIRLLAMVEADPDVAERLTYKVASPASGYELRFAGGGRVQFIARSRTSGRGLTGDVLVIDEAQDLDDDALGALLPTISSRPNSQSWYLGSAPGPMSTVWHRRRADGRKGVLTRRAFFEFSADPSSDLDDRDAWAQANPGLGLRQTEEAIEAERAAMSDEMFARERLSISPDLESGVASVIPADDWARCRQPRTRGDRVAYAIDASPDGKSACIGVSDGVSVLVAEHAPGTAWLPSLLAARLADKPGPVFIDPKGPAGALLVDLAEQGIVPVEVTPPQHAQACGGLLAAVTFDGPELRLHHDGQHALDSAVAGATRRPYGDSWAWNRRTATVDISPLVAVTLARWGALTIKPPVASGYYSGEE